MMPVISVLSPQGSRHCRTDFIKSGLMRAHSSHAESLALPPSLRVRTALTRRVWTPCSLLAGSQLKSFITSHHEYLRTFQKACTCNIIRG